MDHFVIDGFKGFRSRFDDVRLVKEVLEQIPDELGLQAVMPPFLLPYYDGVVPEDCGISAFVFLAGGHLTVHTFSYRECFFADLVYPGPFDVRRLSYLFDAAFPCEDVSSRIVRRSPGRMEPGPVNPTDDFGPHLFIDLGDYRGPRTLDALFDVFDGLPASIDMTPIMRPYVIRGTGPGGEAVVSALTMIAESHISLHVFPDTNRAYFDIFSCKFFESAPVVQKLLETFPGALLSTSLFARGSKYRLLRTEREAELSRVNAWSRAVRSR